MEKENSSVVKIFDYKDIPEKERKLIDPLFQTNELFETLNDCSGESKRDSIFLSEEQRRNELCKNFIFKVQEQNNYSNVIVSFDILCQDPNDFTKCFYCNETAEVVHDNNYLRIMCVTTCAYNSSLWGAFIERKMDNTQEHTLDFVTSNGIERHINHATPGLSAKHFNAIKSINDLDITEYTIIKNLIVTGKHCAEKNLGLYQKLPDSQKIYAGYSKKIK